jgi:hypothetical protein
MARALSQHKETWAPTAEQAEVIDLQATGYSQQACSRVTGVPVGTIWSWNNELAFSAQYRELVQRRTEEFQAAKDAIHDQQVVMALEILQTALSGDMQRERVGDASVTPLRYEAAIQLLRATFWKQKSGEPHKKFGT